MNLKDDTETAPIEIDIADFDANDEAQMTVVLAGRPTTWIWTFAGPGHEKSIMQAAKLAREALHRAKEQEMARVNGRKWTATEDTPDQVRARNVAFVVDRLLGWSPVKMNGEELTFSTVAATKLLMDPRKATLLNQAIDFLADEKVFMKRSATI